MTRPLLSIMKSSKHQRKTLLCSSTKMIVSQKIKLKQSSKPSNQASKEETEITINQVIEE